MYKNVSNTQFADHSSHIVKYTIAVCASKDSCSKLARDTAHRGDPALSLGPGNLSGVLEPSLIFPQHRKCAKPLSSVFSMERARQQVLKEQEQALLVVQLPEQLSQVPVRI